MKASFDSVGAGIKSDIIGTGGTGRSFLTRSTYSISVLIGMIMPEIVLPCIAATGKVPYKDAPFAVK